MQSVAFCPGPRGQRQSLASRCPVRGQPLQRPQPAEPALERVLTTPRTPTASQRLPIHPPRTPERGRARPRVMPVATCRRPSDQRHHRRRSSRTPMAALDSLDSLTDADREHLAPFLHAGPTTARSTALQYVKSDPVSKKEPQGRRILVAAVCAKNPDGGSGRESSHRAGILRARTATPCSAACSARSTTSWGSSRTTPPSPTRRNPTCARARH